MRRFESGPCALSTITLLLALAGAPAWAADTDGDGIADDSDNCTAVPNPDQRDTDHDGFGSACDADLNEDGIVNFGDLAILKMKFFSNDANTDLNGDGFVNFKELALMKQSFFRSPGPKCASCPLDPCAQAHLLLCPGLDAAGADPLLAQCLAGLNPVTNPQAFQTATFYRGITRVLLPAVVEQAGPSPSQIDSVSEALDALGVGSSGRNPLDFQASLPLLPDGTCTVPPGVREEDLKRALVTDLLPRLDAALASLPAVQTSWVDHCTLDRFGVPTSVEIDGSDALLLRAYLQGLRAALDLLQADDAGFDIGALCQAQAQGMLPTLEQFLRDHPAFLTRTSAGAAQAAAIDLAEALDLFEDALNAIDVEVDPQADDLVFIDANDPDGLTPDQEARLRARIDYARASLDGPILSPPGILLPEKIGDGTCGDPTIHLGAFFSGSGARPLLPPFAGDAPIVDSLPDPTFGGFFPNAVAGDLRCVLDEERPEVTIVPADLVTTDQPVHVQIRIQDPPVGASPGSGIDPSSIGVLLSLSPTNGFQFGGPPVCTASLDGAAAATSQEFQSDVTALFQRSVAGDGTVLLDADLDVSSTPVAQGCTAHLNVTADDVYQNTGYGFERLTIYQRGAIVTYAPPSYFGPSPVPISVTVAAPFGDVDLGPVRIMAETSSCSDVRVNGHPTPLLGSTDITALLTAVTAPGVRTWSGTLSATPPPGGGPGCSIFVGTSNLPPTYSYPIVALWITP